MADFFREEAVYIFIALFILGVVIFISTRPFVSMRPKVAVTVTFLVLLAGLIAHYNYRLHHIKEVKEAFYAGKNIICVDKTSKLGGIVVHKGFWSLKGDEFVNPQINRGYNIRQCIVE